MRKSVTPDEARDILLSLKPVYPDIERVKIEDSIGRIAAEDIEAAIDIPPFDRSPYDGYAFLAADTASASPDNPVILHITEELPAGTAPTIEITSGFAAKILTGAPLPAGADAIIKYELTEFSDDTVKIFSPFKSDTDVIRAGDDIRAGSVVVSKGEEISPSLAGLIASSGHHEVPVYRRPVAAVLNTGTELIEPGNALPYGKIYNSSVFTLIGEMRKLGFDAYNAGVVRDDEEEICSRMGELLGKCDVLVTTGGASVGDYDFGVRSAERLGAEILFWKTRLKPGGAMVISRVGDKLILGLSGNPGSALLGLTHIAKPYLLRRAGRRDFQLRRYTVKCAQNSKSAERTRIVRGYMDIRDGEAWFVERGDQYGGILSSFGGCDLYAEIPEGSPELAAGTLVSAWEV